MGTNALCTCEVQCPPPEGPTQSRSSHDTLTQYIYDGSYGEAGSERGYLYPRDYFEPVELHVSNGHERARKAVAVHLPESIAGILHAEAIMAEKSVSALLREWVEERLDLPEIDVGSIKGQNWLKSPISHRS